MNDIQTFFWYLIENLNQNFSKKCTKTKIVLSSTKDKFRDFGKKLFFCGHCYEIGDNHAGHVNLLTLVSPTLQTILRQTCLQEQTKKKIEISSIEMLLMERKRCWQHRTAFECALHLKSLQRENRTGIQHK